MAAADGSGVPLIAEEKVPFTRELAVLVARRPGGEVRTWPVVESVQRDGVCAEVVAPAPDLHDRTREQALDVAVRVAEGLDVVGVLAVELFEVPGADGVPTVLVNELAMRPHNSGHWTIDGAVTSQFEQHLRAVLGLPLGPTAARGFSAMVNLIGALPDPAAVLAIPGAHLHFYGKQPRAGRKVGHITLRADARDVLEERLAQVQRLLT